MSTKRQEANQTKQIRVAKGNHKGLKIFAAREGMPMMALADQIISQYLYETYRWPEYHVDD
ncbi:MAG: hypothetical protein WCV85_05110 [Patescibacteria group bacterium]|jgi:hypothetical protein